jgi:hypothetical protein
MLHREKWDAAMGTRPNEEDAVALGYGGDGAVVAEAMLLEDGTTHITIVNAEVLGEN